MLMCVILVKDDKVDEESLKTRDTAAMELGKLLFQQKRSNGMVCLN